MQCNSSKTFITIAFVIVLASSFTKKVNPEYKAITVYVFLSESCPICQSYTLTLKNLYKKYNNKNISFIGVFPNYYSDADSITAFKKKYSIPFELIVDKDAAITKRLNATITPEVFVENEAHQLLYSGRIDDSFYALGKRRKIISSNDLENVLQQIVTFQKINIPPTQAVGCIITATK
jgi:peroxiredoxin